MEQRSPQTHQQPMPAQHPGVQRPGLHGVKKGNTKLIVTAVLVVLGVLLLAGAAWKLKDARSSLVGVDKSQYQALFLTNGQVYFGKLSSAGKNTVKVEDIYYLQVQQTVQPKQDDQNNSETKQPETSLVKLGGELHGPEDEMFVDRSQVLFWENLKDDGKVVQAITEYQKNPKK